MRNLAKNDSAHWRRVARNGVRIIACPSPSVLRNLIATHLSAVCVAVRLPVLYGALGRRLSRPMAALRFLAVRLGD